MFGLASGVAVRAQPNLPLGMSLTCYFTNGPRAGQTQSYEGYPGVWPIPTGSSCTDGSGSFGRAVESNHLTGPGPAPAPGPVGGGGPPGRGGFLGGTTILPSGQTPCPQHPAILPTSPIGPDGGC